MTKSVLTISPNKRTFDALDIMLKHDVGSVVVVQKGKIVGIITERDITREVTKSFDFFNRPLSNTAAKKIVSVKPSTPVWEAFATMLRKKIRRLPVVKDAKLVGIVTERDLFKWVVRVVYEPNIPRDIRRLVTQSP